MYLMLTTCGRSQGKVGVGLLWTYLGWGGVKNRIFLWTS